jgi:transposase-like protein
MRQHATLRDAILYFSEFEHCKEFMTELRWADGKVKCPQCSAEKVTFLEKARVWKCYGKHPRPTFTLKTGTIFEDSPIGLEKWLPCVWLIINCKNGISSYEVARDLGVTQKTAWFMLQRVRLAMQDDLTGGMLNGEVEVDETFIGGKMRNMHKSRKNELQKIGRRAGKVVVIGALERKGRIRASVAPDRTTPVMRDHVQGNVDVGSVIFSDEHASQWKMDDQYRHQIVNHAERYVDGQIHTNGLENFWSLLKRCLHGTYVSVEPFHLFRYIDEQAFRFNHRKLTDVERFTIVMRAIVGRRLTYEQLTGKAQATQHG